VRQGLSTALISPLQWRQNLYLKSFGFRVSSVGFRVQEDRREVHVTDTHTYAQAQAHDTVDNDLDVQIAGAICCIHPFGQLTHAKDAT
jgi:hypothetical protein